jgi:hypothetical protein
MDVSGVEGIAFHQGREVGDFVLKGGRFVAENGRLTEHIEIQFLGPVPSTVRSALQVIERREERLSGPLLVDLEFADGSRQTDCEVAGYWGGRLGERWFGVSLDLDRVPVTI